MWEIWCNANGARSLLKEISWDLVRNEMCDFTDFVSEQRVTIPESKDTIAVLSKSLFKRPKLPEFNEIFIATCVKETFHWNYTKSCCNKVSFTVKETFRQNYKIFFVIGTSNQTNFWSNYTCFILWNYV